MGRSRFWEADRSSASQQTPLILWIPNVHYRTHNSPPPFPMLSQIDLVHGPHPTQPLEDPFYYYPSIYASVFQVDSFPQVFLPQPCIHLSSLSHVLHVLPISVFKIANTRPKNVTYLRLDLYDPVISTRKRRALTISRWETASSLAHTTDAFDRRLEKSVEIRTGHYLRV